MILALVVLSAGVAVWSYWGDIQALWAPPPQAALAPPPARAAGVQFTRNPQLKIRASTPEALGRGENLVAAPPALPAALAGGEEPTPEEPEGNLPEKLNPIRITEGEEMRRMERQLNARKKMDDPSAILEYLKAARIGGVRVAGPMSKLIFNGQVYHVGDTVSDQPRVFIEKITQAQVVFRDPKGNEYPVKY